MFVAWSEIQTPKIDMTNKTTTGVPRQHAYPTNTIRIGSAQKINVQVRPTAEDEANEQSKLGRRPILRRESPEKTC